MDKIRIRGGNVLSGKLPISGAKNAALPLLAASLLTDDTLTLSNLPRLADISTMGNLLEQHGVDIKVIKNGSDRSEGRTATLTAREITSTTAPYDLVRKMRASVLVLGPLVARCGEAQVSLPGGCAIGTRPVDLHLHGQRIQGAAAIVGGPDLDRAKEPGLRVHPGLRHVRLEAVGRGQTRRGPFVRAAHLRRVVVAALRDQGALGSGHPERLRQLSRDLLDQHAQPSARDMAFGADLVHHVHGVLDRYREREAHEATGTAEDLGIDADHLAIQVEQGTA